MSSESTSSTLGPAGLSFLPAPAVSRPGAMPSPAGPAPGIPTPYVAASAWAPTETEVAVVPTADAEEEWSVLHPAAAGEEASPEPAAPASSDRASLEAMDWLPAVDEVADDPVEAGAVLEQEDTPAPATESERSEPAEEAEEDLPPWMAWIEEEQAAEARDEATVVGIEDLLAEPEHVPEAADAEPALHDLVGQVVEDPERAAIVSSVAEATSRLSEAEAPMPAAFAGVFHEVADRLENIAGSLRRRSSGEASAPSPSTDPLELLLTGFVLGYVARQGREPPPGQER